METLLIIGSGLLFIAIVMMVAGAMGYSDQRRHMEHRLTVSEGFAGRVQSLRITLEDGLLKRFDALVSPARDEDRAKIRQRLVRAGYRWSSAMRVYFASKAALTIGMGILGVLIVTLFGQTMPLPIVLALVMAPALLGNLMPSFWVERRIQRRAQEAELGFPDTLDMLLICIEAGLGIDQACRRVSEQIGKTCPVLAEELTVVNEELLAGKQRALVFRDFADRLGVNDIKAFTTVLKQSDEFGVSVAETLRVYAAEMRNKRVMRAEEKANVMPVKVAMGSIFFTVPPTMLLIAGPSLIILMRAFAKL